MDEEIAIIDYGSQYTLLIARCLRQLNIFCRIYSGRDDDFPSTDGVVKGIILSGGPHSVLDENSPKFNFNRYKKIPIIGICYGAQLIANYFSGKVKKRTANLNTSEFGLSKLSLVDTEFDEDEEGHSLFENIPLEEYPVNVWMSHQDTIIACGEGYPIASTEDVLYGAFKIRGKHIYGLQFHPEVHETHFGDHILQNFGVICGLEFTWVPETIYESALQQARSDIFPFLEKIKKKQEPYVVMAVSGGVDSTVASYIIQDIVGQHQFYPVLVDTGLMRQDEIENTRKAYQEIGFVNLRVIDASKEFFKQLKKTNSPEEKRKIIGHLFIKIFQNEVKKIQSELNHGSIIKRKVIHFLGQGTIYPDIIESSQIKSHHNVGGLPKKLGLKLVEPLKSLFKDDVRSMGEILGIPDKILNRHPFPGPGFAIRIIGRITPEDVSLLREADYLATKYLTETGYYDIAWQFGVILLPSIKTVGVQGDNRVYLKTIVIRSVNSLNGMTATVQDIPIDVLRGLSTYICNKMPHIGRVVYDITDKPPATIEWE